MTDMEHIAEVTSRMADAPETPPVLAEALKQARVERIPVTSRDQWLALRRQDVTASVVGCLLGVHEYQTPYGLWALKTGAVVEDPEETGPMRRGRLLEPVAVAMLREERPAWQVKPAGVYMRDPVARLGATPDVLASDPERPGIGIVQIKTVEPGVFRRKWRDDEGEVTPPLWIAVQAIVEAHLAGAQWAAVAAMTVGFGVDLHVVPVPIHAGVVERTYAAVADFWRMVAEDRAPDPDYGRDLRLVETLFAGRDEITDLSADNALPALADEREAISSAKSTIEERLKEIKAEFLVKLAGAEAGRIADGRLITARRVERKGYEVKPSSYVSVTVKKARTMETAS
jgi:hypothetical protein